MNLNQCALRETLDELSAKLRCTSEDTTTNLAVQMTKSELSLVRILSSQCSLYLVGSASMEEESGGFFNLGNVLDTCDATELAAQELRIARIEAEEALERACRSQLVEEVKEDLARDLIAREVSSMENFSARSSRISEEISRGLLVICRDVRAELLKALESGANGVSKTKEELEKLGVESFSRIERATSNWLLWNAKKVTNGCSQGCPLLEETELSPAISQAMASDIEFTDLVIAVRRAMALRRQQVRINSLLRRVAAARTVAGQIRALMGRVVVA